MDSTIFIVDDDAAIRDALSLLLGLHGYRTLVFADAPSFLNTYKPEWYGCLLIDLRMPHMDGLSLQQELLKRGSKLPVIIITGHGDVSSAREAFRASAIDFLEKPLDQERLLQAVAEGLDRQLSQRSSAQAQERLQRSLGELTPREHEVLHLVVAGNHNRDIALKLGISVRTVEVHKARMMTKLGVKSLSQLVHLCLGHGQPNTDDLRFLRQDTN